MRILSIERIGPAFLLWVEEGPFYKKLRVEADGSIEISHEAPRSNFKSYRHFVGVINKGACEYPFLCKPIRVKTLSIQELERIEAG